MSNVKQANAVAPHHTISSATTGPKDAPFLSCASGSEAQPSTQRPDLRLTNAVRKSASRFAAAVSSYQTNVCVVNTYVTSVLSSSLPTVTPQPADWPDYVTAWEQASSLALNWVNTCMARLLDVPSNVQSYNSSISALLQDATTQATTLAGDPSNQAALDALTNDLTAIPQQLSLVETFVSGAVAALQNFQDQLPNMATQLTTLSQKAALDNNADQAQIEQLQEAIQTLQNDINSLTSSIIGLAIADGVALTLGTVASIVAFPVGLLTWFVLGPAVAVATTFIALDAENIKADKSAIDQNQGQMTQLTAACSVLATMSTTYANLATQSQAIQSALQAVLSEWQVLSSDIALALTDIQTATTDKGEANYAAVVSDLGEATAEWIAIYQQAGSLVLTLQVNNASLAIGMSQNQVQAALATGTTVDLITYFNQLGVAA